MRSYREIPGDGGSGVMEQIDARRRRMADALADVRHFVAVGSGKGGVGKSTLALALGRELAARGSSVALFDADLNGPSQAHLAGLGGVPLLPGTTGIALPRDRQGIGVVSLGSVVPRDRPLEFASVAEGSTHVWRATREMGVASELLAAVEWGRLDWLLVDLPPGAERTRQWCDLLGSSAALVLVTLPSELSHSVVARSAAAMVGAPNRRLGYIENMSGYVCAGCDALRPLFPRPRAAGLDLPCLGSIPFDPELCAAGDRGEAPRGASRLALQAIADTATRIERALEPDA